ncbi:MAG: hypothetical protein WCC30_18010 [Candidatus Dormiibacterota bacterium]
MSRARGDRKAVTPREVPRVCRNPHDDQIPAVEVIRALDTTVAGDADLPALPVQGGVNVNSSAGFDVLAKG